METQIWATGLSTSTKAKILKSDKFVQLQNEIAMNPQQDEAI